MDTSNWLIQRNAPTREEHSRFPFLHHVAPRALKLAEGEAWSTHSARSGLVLRCESGKLWVTVEGDPEDHILLAPDSFTVPTHGRVAVLALSPASLEVVAAPHLAH
jgi:hypothetical protein